MNSSTDTLTSDQIESATISVDELTDEVQS